VAGAAQGAQVADRVVLSWAYVIDLIGRRSAEYAFAVVSSEDSGSYLVPVGR